MSEDLVGSEDCILMFSLLLLWKKSTQSEFSCFLYFLCVKLSS